MVVVIITIAITDGEMWRERAADTETVQFNFIYFIFVWVVLNGPEFRADKQNIAS